MLYLCIATQQTTVLLNLYFFCLASPAQDLDSLKEQNAQLEKFFENIKYSSSSIAILSFF